MNRAELERLMGIGQGSDTALEPGQRVPLAPENPVVGPTDVSQGPWARMGHLRDAEASPQPPADTRATGASAAPPPGPSMQAPRRNGKGSIAELGLVAEANPAPAPRLPPPPPPGTLTTSCFTGSAPVSERAPAPPPRPIEDTSNPPSPFLADLPRFSFITGPAGTGKTYQVQQRIEANPPGSVILAATTGIAAVNLGENVVTINSLLGYFDTPSLRDKWTTGSLEQVLQKLAGAGMQNLVIDEVSMLDGEALRLLHAAVESTNEGLDASGKPMIALTLTGDFLQLPPIKAKYAFEVQTWEHFAPNTTKLTTMHRQSDQAFLNALAHARAGRGVAAAEYLSQFCRDQVDTTFQGTTLMAKNEAVDRYNWLELNRLTGTALRFDTSAWGEQRKEWKHIPAKLDLKLGALVMVLANKKDGTDRERFLCVNGDLGTVKEVEADKGIVWVELKRNGLVVPVDYITRQCTIPLDPERRKELQAAQREDLIKDNKYEVIGELTYMPLRPAWATTTHKSQGLTLDAVQIDIRDGFFKSAGMVYVALSRVRTPQGLRIVGNPRLLQSRIVLDPRVRAWV